MRWLILLALYALSAFAQGSHPVRLSKDPKTNQYTIRYYDYENGTEELFRFYPANAVQMSVRTSLSKVSSGAEYRYRFSNLPDSPLYAGSVYVPCPDPIRAQPGSMLVESGDMKKLRSPRDIQGQFCKCNGVALAPGRTSSSDCAFITSTLPGLIIGLFAGVPDMPPLEVDGMNNDEMLRLFRSVAYETAKITIVGPKYRPTALSSPQDIAAVFSGEWTIACQNALVTGAETCQAGKERLDQLAHLQGAEFRKALKEYLAWVNASAKAIDPAFVQATLIDGEVALEALH